MEGGTDGNGNAAVSQTSAGSSYDGINVDVTVDAGQLRYEWSEYYNFDTSVGNVDFDIDSADADAGSVLARQRRDDDNLDVVTLSRDVNFMDVSGGSHDTKQSVFIVTDYTTPIGGGTDSDYLAGGIWLWVPDPVPDTVDPNNDYEYGVFVDGNDPFDQTRVQALTGTATYEGATSGMYTGTQEFNFFNASVRLTANFGANTEFGTIEGTIEGTISGFKDVNDNPFFDGPTSGMRLVGFSRVIRQGRTIVRPMPENGADGSSVTPPLTQRVLLPNRDLLRAHTVLHLAAVLMPRVFWGIS